MHEDPTRALVTAVTAGDAARAAELLAGRPDLRARLDDALPGLPFDGTLLLAAVSRGDRPMIELLLDSGANINQRSRWWAGGFGVLDGNPELADFLIERGATVDVHAAARLGRVDLLADLLDEDPARVRARGGDGQLPLHVASTVDVARLLLDRGADVDARDIDHESTAAQYLVRDHQNVVRLLVARGCATDILMAAALGDIDLVRRHLDREPGSIATTVSDRFFPMANPRAGGTIYFWTLGRNQTAPAIAREFGHEDVFRLLMDRSPADLRLALAFEGGDEAGVMALLRAAPDSASTLAGREPHRLADMAQDGNAAAVRLMLAAGWPVDAKGAHGGTALHFAAWHGNAALVRDILRSGPQIDARGNEFNLSPLGWALHGSLHSPSCRTGDYAGTVHALLDAGATHPAPTDALQASEAALQVLRQRRRR